MSRRLYATIWAEDAIQVLGGRVIQGRKGIVGKTLLAGAPEHKKAVIKVDQLRVFDNTAHEMGTYWLTDRNGKTKEGKSVTVWKRQSDGTWKIQVEVSAQY